jgi:hypothetical protein
VLSSTANGQLQSVRIQITAIRQHRTKQTTKTTKDIIIIIIIIIIATTTTTTSTACNIV